jgi:trans-aconitate 2-methyltransferase
MSDWNASSYHRLSNPQQTWGRRVLERLAPARGERILDIGCGTGRLTSEISEQSSTRVVGIDRSWSMLAEAARAPRREISLVQADAADLPFARPAFDAVFSTATFHWVRDHPRLFSEIHRVLRPGGRLVSQAGGGPNLARLYDRCRSLRHAPEFAHCFEEWRDPWIFAGVDDTRARVEDAGFTDVKVWLEPALTSFPDGEAYADFASTVCLRHHLDRLPPARHSEFLRRLTELAADDDPPFTLDYWRLNIDARKQR